MVYFVGAGTGAVDLITVRGMNMLEKADVVIYAGSLVNPELLKYTKKDCSIYNSAKMTLEEVIQVIEQAEQNNKNTVRLHTGDPSIYGAVRMEGKTAVPEEESIESLASHGTSMAIYLSTGMLGELRKRLLKGAYRPDTPAVIVYKATWPEEEAYLCTIETLEETAKAHGITKTAIILIGDAIAPQKYSRSRLYAPDFETEFRGMRL